MARVAIDCDGVLANPTPAAAQVMNAILPNFIPDPFSFKPVNDHWIPSEHLEEWKQRVQQSHNWWLYMDAYLENITAFNKFVHQMPHIVYIVTARFPTAGVSPEQQTLLWLRSCGVDTDVRGHLGVIVVPRLFKPYVMRSLLIDYSVDDNADTVRNNNLHGSTEQVTHRSYLLDQPWNQGSTEPRVRNLSEFFEMVNRNEHTRSQSTSR